MPISGIRLSDWFHREERTWESHFTSTTKLHFRNWSFSAWRSQRLGGRRLGPEICMENSPWRGYKSERPRLGRFLPPNLTVAGFPAAAVIFRPADFRAGKRAVPGSYSRDARNADQGRI